MSNRVLSLVERPDWGSFFNSGGRFYGTTAPIMCAGAQVFPLDRGTTEIFSGAFAPVVPWSNGTTRNFRFLNCDHQGAAIGLVVPQLNFKFLEVKMVSASGYVS